MHVDSSRTLNPCTDGSLAPAVINPEVIGLMLFRPVAAGMKQVLVRPDESTLRGAIAETVNVSMAG